jgi:fused signal recognition particle receptor
MFNKLKSGINGVIKKIKIKELSEKELDPIITELVNLMVRNEVGIVAAEVIGEALKEELLSMEHTRFKSAKPMVQEALSTAIRSILTVDKSDEFDFIQSMKDIKEESRPAIIMVLGINGTGKTTTIAKLTKLLLKNDLSVVLAASDTYRAGSIQQLGKHAERLGVKLISQDYNADPAAVAIDAIDHAEAKGVDVVIIDTAGRMQNNINLVRELEKIKRLTEPDLNLFIGDALAGNDVIRQVDQFHKSIGIDGIIMTKLDSDAKGGAILSVAHTVQKPIIFLGVGQSYDDLIAFDPEFIVKQVIP